MFGWAMSSSDYSQAYLNADIDEICVMRAPISVREYSPTGERVLLAIEKGNIWTPQSQPTLGGVPA
jgi:hypothetical protein